MSRDRKVYIGIDVGGTKILAASIQSDGRILTRDKQSTPAGASALEVSRTICDVAETVMRETKGPIAGIGLGIPGLVAPNFRDILVTPNVNLGRYPLARDIHDRFHVPVFLANDVNCGLMGEQWLGAARQIQHVIGIFPGTGVGGAIIINGHLYSGAQGAAAEIGHTIIDFNSPIRHAGVSGSLEALASRQAIERRIREGIESGRKTIVTDILGDDLGRVKSKVIAKALRKKDPLVTEIIEDVCQILGQACISFRHFLNPEMILFGGGLIEGCGAFMLPRIQAISAADPFFKGIDDCKIVKSQLEDDAVILGAVKLVLDRDPEE